MTQTTTSLSLQTIELDVGDRRSAAIILDPSGEVLEELKITTTRTGIHSAFGSRASSRIALEVGTHSAWIEQELQSMGREVFVANPRKVGLIGHSGRKSHRIDPRFLLAWPVSPRNCLRRFDTANRMHAVVCPPSPWSPPRGSAERGGSCRIASSALP